MSEIRDNVLEAIEKKISEKNLEKAWLEISDIVEQVLEDNGEFGEELKRSFKMKVLAYKVDCGTDTKQFGEVMEIENGLKPMQEFVGGYIEVFPITNNILLN